MINVLYCGMAWDIMSPLLLIPNLDKLYVIDNFDSAYSSDGTFTGQQQDIKNILISGTENEYKRQIFIDSETDILKKYDIHSLAEPCKIVCENKNENQWILEFMYLGQLRKLIHYQYDFHDEWPSDIINITHVMSIGAPFDIAELVLLKMLTTRVTTNFQYYALWFNNKNYTHKITVKNGEFRNGTKIAKIEINSNKLFTNKKYLDYINIERSKI